MATRRSGVPPATDIAAQDTHPPPSGALRGPLARRSCASAAGEHAAVDGDRLAGDVAGLAREQEAHEARHLVRLADPPERDARLDLAAKRRQLRQVRR